MRYKIDDFAEKPGNKIDDFAENFQKILNKNELSVFILDYIDKNIKKFIAFFIDNINDNFQLKILKF